MDLAGDMDYVCSDPRYSTAEDPTCAEGNEVKNVKDQMPETGVNHFENNPAIEL